MTKNRKRLLACKLQRATPSVFLPSKPSGDRRNTCIGWRRPEGSADVGGWSMSSRQGLGLVTKTGRPQRGCCSGVSGHRTTQHFVVPLAALLTGFGHSLVSLLITRRRSTSSVAVHCYNWAAQVAKEWPTVVRPITFWDLNFERASVHGLFADEYFNLPIWHVRLRVNVKCGFTGCLNYFQVSTCRDENSFPRRAVFNAPSAPFSVLLMFYFSIPLSCARPASWCVHLTAPRCDSSERQNQRRYHLNHPTTREAELVLVASCIGCRPEESAGC